MSDSPAHPRPSRSDPAGHHHQQSGIVKLAVGAIGIVFGDIGTSPIYAFRETFAGHHPLARARLEIIGVLSLIFWSMMIVVTIKYVTVIMRADNKGEGGSLALLALISRKSDGRERSWTAGIVLLGVFACALFYGDSMITPAISVLSAVEGLTTVQSRLRALGRADRDRHPCRPVRDPVARARRGWARCSARSCSSISSPSRCSASSTSSPSRGSFCETLNPLNAVQFFLVDGWSAFLAMGSVVLAVTGAEALYADMGHFGRKPIGVSWLFFVMPALMLNYMGQGAMILSLDAAAGHAAVEQSLLHPRPDALRLPLVILATFATIIASQAVISGAFSVTQQAMQLGFIPRLRIRHTSAGRGRPDLHPGGQLGADGAWSSCSFCSSRHRATSPRPTESPSPARCSSTPACSPSSCCRCGSGSRGWRCPCSPSSSLVDIAYFAANLIKVPDGGWFPLLIGLIAFTLLTTWARGRKLMIKRMNEAAMPASIFIKSAASQRDAGARHGGVHDHCRGRHSARACCTISSTTRCCTSGCCC